MPAPAAPHGWPRQVVFVRRELWRHLAPEEDELRLVPAPFHTLREAAAADFLTLYADPDGLDPNQAWVIGDFGPGSDAPLVLDARGSAAGPPVLRLRWSTVDGLPNRWVPFAPDLTTLVAWLSLTAL